LPHRLDAKFSSMCKRLACATPTCCLLLTILSLRRRCLVTRLPESWLRLVPTSRKAVFSLLAVDSAKRAEEKETAAEWQLNGALREAEFGNLVQARNETASAVALVSTRDVQVLATLVLALVQDSARAQKMADELEKQNPLNTVIIGYWLPTIRTAIEIGRNNATKAVELARAAIPYELGEPNPQAEFGAFLYPAYVRGHAYLLLHQGKQAVAEFQKFLDHRNLVANCFLAPLAHLQLGRAYAMQGDTAKARAAYEDFFALWKDADPDIPILKQAKAEYANLQSQQHPSVAIINPQVCGPNASINCVIVRFNASSVRCISSILLTERNTVV
jgi:tetratricopeptide (TPR) repeat protein